MRSSISSRIMATKCGWLPTVAARTMFRPSSSHSCARFDVEIPEHFHVIGQEADRHDDHVARRAVGVQSAQRVADVGLEPGLSRRPAAALIGELVVARCPGPRRPAAPPRAVGPRSGTSSAIGSGNAVGRVDRPRPRRGASAGICSSAVADALDHRLDEAGMIEERSQLVDRRAPAVRPACGPRSMFSRYCRQTNRSCRPR